MGTRIFGIVCFVLALMFSIAAVKGMISENFGIVLIIPALAAIVLVMVGINDYKKAH
jgi:hypothetical protein